MKINVPLTAPEAPAQPSVNGSRSFEQIIIWGIFDDLIRIYNRPEANDKLQRRLEEFEVIITLDDHAEKFLLRALIGHHVNYGDPAVLQALLAKLVEMRVIIFCADSAVRSISFNPGPLLEILEARPDHKSAYHWQREFDLAHGKEQITS